MYKNSVIGDLSYRPVYKYNDYGHLISLDGE